MIFPVCTALERRRRQGWGAQGFASTCSLVTTASEQHISNLAAAALAVNSISPPRPCRWVHGRCGHGSAELRQCFSRTSTGGKPGGWIPALCEVYVFAAPADPSTHATISKQRERTNTEPSPTPAPLFVCRCAVNRGRCYVPPPKMAIALGSFSWILLLPLRAAD